jgi:hypothetical protein
VIKFYFNAAPNPMKVALFLEEAELEYAAIPVDTRKGVRLANSTSGNRGAYLSCAGSGARSGEAGVRGGGSSEPGSVPKFRDFSRWPT